MKFLYHGSHCGGIDTLDPKVSYDLEAYVYATKDPLYALVRAGNQKGLIREDYHGMCRPFELAELYPNAFEEMFKCDGYIYKVKADEFTVNPDNPLEFISDKPVNCIECIHMHNIWNALLDFADLGMVSLHYYGDTEYWKTIRGGLEGYLERRRKRKENLEKTLKLRGLL